MRRVQRHKIRKKGRKIKCCVTEFAKPIRRKEQLESGKSEDKSHNKGESVGRDRISK